MSHCQFTTRKDLCSQDRRYTTQPVNQFQSILSISSRAQPVKQIDQKPLFLGFSKENWHLKRQIIIIALPPTSLSNKLTRSQCFEVTNNHNSRATYQCYRKVTFKAFLFYYIIDYYVILKEIALKFGILSTCLSITKLNGAFVCINGNLPNWLFGGMKFFKDSFNIIIDGHLYSIHSKSWTEDNKSQDWRRLFTWLCRTLDATSKLDTTIRTALSTQHRYRHYTC